MNIIAHNCIGARIYQELETEYKNPFIWSVIPPDDFLYLYNNFDNINFKNIKVLLEAGRNSCVVSIDGKINIFFVHYKYDKECLEPDLKSEMDIFYSGIKDYAKKKYLARLERMIEKPVFIVSDREFPERPNFNFKKNDLLKYIEKDDCIVVTCDKEIDGRNVVHTNGKNLDPKEIAKIILQDEKAIKILGLIEK